MLRVADLFCGAGGFDCGLKLALEQLAAEGYPGELSADLVAVNHWQTAIDSHGANHPDATRFCADIFSTPPREAVPDGDLDLLLASPTCTYFSRARGSAPISWDQRKGRMTPTQVVRWARELSPKVIIVENVPEFRFWGPVCQRRTVCQRHGWDGPKSGERAICGRPDRARRGSLFRAWVRRLERLGYAVEWRILCAANFGDPTTRERFFLIARRDGVGIVWPEPTHAQDGLHPSRPGVRLPRWRAAREAIDWKLRGRSIFRRKKPLAAKTLLRILAGIIRFRWPERYVRKLTAYILSLGIAIPETQLSVGRDGQLGLFAAGLGEPFTFPANQGKTRTRGLRSVEEPLDTVVAKDMKALVEPFMLSQASGGAPRSVEEPVPTIPTDGAHALVAAYYGNGSCRPVGEPLDTVTTKARFGLVEPGEHAFITAAFGERPGQAPRNRSIDEPVTTVCAKGRIPLVEAADDLDDVDILFRMLEPHELSVAMGFPRRYRFTGNKGERTRQIGNAVPVNTAAALVAAVLRAGALAGVAA